MIHYRQPTAFLALILSVLAGVSALQPFVPGDPHTGDGDAADGGGPVLGLSEDENEPVISSGSGQAEDGGGTVLGLSEDENEPVISSGSGQAEDEIETPRWSDLSDAESDEAQSAGTVAISSATIVEGEPAPDGSSYDVLEVSIAAPGSAADPAGDADPAQGADDEDAQAAQNEELSASEAMHSAGRTSSDEDDPGFRDAELESQFQSQIAELERRSEAARQRTEALLRGHGEIHAERMQILAEARASLAEDRDDERVPALERLEALERQSAGYRQRLERAHRRAQLLLRRHFEAAASLSEAADQDRDVALNGAEVVTSQEPDEEASPDPDLARIQARLDEARQDAEQDINSMTFAQRVARVSRMAQRMRSILEDQQNTLTESSGERSVESDDTHEAQHSDLPSLDDLFSQPLHNELTQTHLSSDSLDRAENGASEAPIYPAETSTEAAAAEFYDAPIDLDTASATEALERSYGPHWNSYTGRPFDHLRQSYNAITDGNPPRGAVSGSSRSNTGSSQANLYRRAGRIIIRAARQRRAEEATRSSFPSLALPSLARRRPGQEFSRDEEGERARRFAFRREMLQRQESEMLQTTSERQTNSERRPSEEILEENKAEHAQQETKEPERNPSSEDAAAEDTVPAEFKCPICLEPLQPHAVSTFAPCGHTVCRVCRERFPRGERCPSCRTTIESHVDSIFNRPGAALGQRLPVPSETAEYMMSSVFQEMEWSGSTFEEACFAMFQQLQSGRELQEEIDQSRQNQEESRPSGARRRVMMVPMGNLFRRTLHREQNRSNIVNRGDAAPGAAAAAARPPFDAADAARGAAAAAALPPVPLSRLLGIPMPPGAAPPPDPSDSNRQNNANAPPLPEQFHRASSGTRPPFGDAFTGRHSPGIDPFTGRSFRSRPFTGRSFRDNRSDPPGGFLAGTISAAAPANGLRLLQRSLPQSHTGTTSISLNLPSSELGAAAARLQLLRASHERTRQAVRSGFPSLNASLLTLEGRLVSEGGSNPNQSRDPLSPIQINRDEEAQNEGGENEAGQNQDQPRSFSPTSIADHGDSDDDDFPPPPVLRRQDAQDGTDHPGTAPSDSSDDSSVPRPDDDELRSIHDIHETLPGEALAAASGTPSESSSSPDLVPGSFVYGGMQFFPPTIRDLGRLQAIAAAANSAAATTAATVGSSSIGRASSIGSTNPADDDINDEGEDGEGENNEGEDGEGEGQQQRPRSYSFVTDDIESNPRTGVVDQMTLDFINRARARGHFRGVQWRLPALNRPNANDILPNTPMRSTALGNFFLSNRHLGYLPDLRGADGAEMESVRRDIEQWVNNGNNALNGDDNNNDQDQDQSQRDGTLSDATVRERESGLGPISATQEMTGIIMEGESSNGVRTEFQILPSQPDAGGEQSSPPIREISAIRDRNNRIVGFAMDPEDTVVHSANRPPGQVLVDRPADRPRVIEEPLPHPADEFLFSPPPPPDNADYRSHADASADASRAVGASDPVEVRPIDDAVDAANQAAEAARNAISNLRAAIDNHSRILAITSGEEDPRPSRTSQREPRTAGPMPQPLPSSIPWDAIPNVEDVIPGVQESHSPISSTSVAQPQPFSFPRPDQPQPIFIEGGRVVNPFSSAAIAARAALSASSSSATSGHADRSESEQQQFQESAATGASGNSIASMTEEEYNRMRIEIEQINEDMAAAVLAHSNGDDETGLTENQIQVLERRARQLFEGLQAREQALQEQLAAVQSASSRDQRQDENGSQAAGGEIQEANALRPANSPTEMYRQRRAQRALEREALQNRVRIDPYPVLGLPGDAALFHDGTDGATQHVAGEVESRSPDDLLNDDIEQTRERARARADRVQQLANVGSVAWAEERGRVADRHGFDGQRVASGLIRRMESFETTPNSSGDLPPALPARRRSAQIDEQAERVRQRIEEIYQRRVQRRRRGDEVPNTSDGFVSNDVSPIRTRTPEATSGSSLANEIAGDDNTRSAEPSEPIPPPEVLNLLAQVRTMFGTSSAPPAPRAAATGTGPHFSDNADGNANGNAAASGMLPPDTTTRRRVSSQPIPIPSPARPDAGGGASLNSGIAINRNFDIPELPSSPPQHPSVLGQTPHPQARLRQRRHAQVWRSPEDFWSGRGSFQSATGSNAPSDGASASRVRPSDGGLAEAAMQIDFSDLLNAGSDSFPNTDRTVEQVLNDSLSRLVQVLSDQQDASAATSHDDPMDTTSTTPDEEEFVPADAAASDGNDEDNQPEEDGNGEDAP